MSMARLKDAKLKMGSFGGEGGEETKQCFEQA